MATIALDREKQELVTELRKRISDLLPEFKNDYRRHDANLVKFLIARDFNITKAEEMLRKNLEWRRQNHANNARMLPICRELDAYYSFYIPGFDRLGRPVILAPVGQWNAIAAAEAGLKPQIKVMFVQFCETMFDLCEELTTESTMIVSYLLVLDLAGFDYRQLVNKDVFNIFRDLLSVLLNNYPENMYGIRIINAPRLFAFAWSLVKPLLTARSLSKIQIFGAKKEDWKNCLLEDVHEDTLPSSYGGANTTCESTSKFVIGEGLVEMVPLEILPEDELISRYVEPGKAVTVNVHADAGDLILWNFKTDDNDIGFQVDYDNSQPVIEYSRVDSHKFMQKGTIKCEFTGKYQILFDNSFSMMKGKKLKYAVATKSK